MGKWSDDEKAIYDEMANRNVSVMEMYKSKRLKRSFQQIRDHGRLADSKRCNAGKWTAAEKVIFDEMLQLGLSNPEMYAQKRLKRSLQQIQKYRYHIQLRPTTKYNTGAWSAEEKAIYEEMVTRGLGPIEMFKEHRLKRTFIQIRYYQNKIRQNPVSCTLVPLQQSYRRGSWTSEEKTVMEEMLQRQLSPPEIFSEKRVNRSYLQIENYCRLQQQRKIQWSEEKKVAVYNELVRLAKNQDKPANVVFCMKVAQSGATYKVQGHFFETFDDRQFLWKRSGPTLGHAMKRLSLKQF